MSLPACILIVAVAVQAGWSPLQAQVRYRVLRAENFRRAASPRAPILAQLAAGSEHAGGTTDGDWIEITLDGWVWSASVRRASDDTFDLEVSAQGGENLRAAPNGAIVARLSEGTLLSELGRDGQWVRVRRIGWTWGQSLRVVTPSEESDRVEERAAPPDTRLDRAVTASATGLLAVADGDTVGRLEAEAPVKILARSGDWVRVQTEGWVREQDLQSSAPGVLSGVSGAEVRAQPSEFEGKLLQWTVQYLAMEEADELRSEIPLGQPYMLARGPLPEAGFVYITVPRDRLEEIERLSPLTQLVIIGRLRTARTRYLGNPVLELVDVAVRQR